VTGSNTGIMAGSAIVLVGAGAGLFMVARRRRVKFTA
jgi:LPXTG-motif cell wall-anchored protein